MRVFNPLFKSDEPDSHDDILTDVNPKSEEIYPNAIIEKGFHEIKRRAPWPAEEGEKDKKGAEAGPESVRFQGLRVAYFAVDQDSSEETVVLNKIVGLKEDSGKAS